MLSNPASIPCTSDITFRSGSAARAADSLDPDPSGDTDVGAELAHRLANQRSSHTRTG
jgi:hypothetical protein